MARKIAPAIPVIHVYLDDPDPVSPELDKPDLDDIEFDEYGDVVGGINWYFRNREKFLGSE
jgi:hypothetical protein